MEQDLRSLKNKARLQILAAAFIWGVTYLFQSEGAQKVGPFFFNATRYWIGVLVLLPLAIKRNRDENGKVDFFKDEEYKSFLRMGILVDGTIMFVMITCQQVGLKTASPGKAGFLVSLSTAFTPIILTIMGQKINKTQWLGVLAAIIGAALMSLDPSSGVNFGDLLIIASAILTSLNIIFGSYFNKRLESISFVVFRFIHIALLNTILSLVLEKTTIEMIKPALFSLLFTGIFSSGMANALMSYALSFLDSFEVQKIFALESIIGLGAAWAFTGYTLSLRELVGGFIIFVAVMFMLFMEEKEFKKEVEEEIIEKYGDEE